MDARPRAMTETSAPSSPWLAAAAGAANLVVVMGVGRFAYTAMLPFMQAESGFSRAFAGNLAAANYLGYLVGAWLAGRVRRRTVVLRLALAASVLTTAGMGLAAGPAAWFTLRTISGLASGLAFVLGYAQAFRRMDPDRRLPLSGAMFGGVGLGISLSALLAPVLASWGDANTAWLGLGGLAAILAPLPWLVLAGDAPLPPPRAEDAPTDKGRPARTLSWLVAAYGLEGLGYIVSATFIPAVVVDLGGSAGSAASAWLLVGLSAAPSAALWGWIGRRTKPGPALLAAYLLQATGIALSAVAGQAGAMAGAVLFGATFMGIVTLATGWGAGLAPGRTAATVGRLTAVYGACQIIGPWAAGHLADAAGGYQHPLSLSAAAILAGGLLLVPPLLSRTPRKK